MIIMSSNAPTKRRPKPSLRPLKSKKFWKEEKPVTKSRTLTQGKRNTFKWTIQVDTPAGHTTKRLKIVKGIEIRPEEEQESELYPEQKAPDKIFPNQEKMPSSQLDTKVMRFSKPTKFPSDLASTGGTIQQDLGDSGNTCDDTLVDSAHLPMSHISDHANSKSTFEQLPPLMTSIEALRRGSLSDSEEESEKDEEEQYIREQKYVQDYIRAIHGTEEYTNETKDDTEVGNDEHASDEDSQERDYAYVQNYIDSVKHSELNRSKHSDESGGNSDNSLNQASGHSQKSDHSDDESIDLDRVFGDEVSHEVAVAAQPLLTETVTDECSPDEGLSREVIHQKSQQPRRAGKRHNPNSAATWSQSGSSRSFTKSLSSLPENQELSGEQMQRMEQYQFSASGSNTSDFEPQVPPWAPNATEPNDSTPSNNIDGKIRHPMRSNSKGRSKITNEQEKDSHADDTKREPSSKAPTCHPPNDGVPIDGTALPTEFAEQPAKIRLRRPSNLGVSGLPPGARVPTNQMVPKVSTPLPKLSGPKKDSTARFKSQLPRRLDNEGRGSLNKSVPDFTTNNSDNIAPEGTRIVSSTHSTTYAPARQQSLLKNQDQLLHSYNSSESESSSSAFSFGIPGLKAFKSTEAMIAKDPNQVPDESLEQSISMPFMQLNLSATDGYRVSNNDEVASNHMRTIEMSPSSLKHEGQPEVFTPLDDINASPPKQKIDKSKSRSETPGQSKKQALMRVAPRRTKSGHSHGDGAKDHGRNIQGEKVGTRTPDIVNRFFSQFGNNSLSNLSASSSQLLIDSESEET